MESMEENDVWDLEELPMDIKDISCRWVLRKKRDDVKTAFLNGELNENIYMYQPKGYDDNTGRKCKLKKSLYGLKQAPRQWYQKFLNFVNKLGFKQLNSEYCIFISKIVEKHKMIDSNPSSIPIETKATAAMFEKGNHFNGAYRELAGSLLYLPYVCRPDILFAVNCLSELQEHPTDSAWCALKKILRYLKGTAKMKINYKKCNLYDSDLSLDADWGSNLNDRKSVSGYLIMFLFCNNPVLWCVNKQKCIALSSTEAEIIALSKGVQDLLWIKGIASEIVCVKNLIVQFSPTFLSPRTCRRLIILSRPAEGDVECSYFRLF
ncbi:Copia protein [Araneus ventricosus]|uniref:Copia protein n=1 Tax=Araneus ventricosus TaxID=182803 RepID=A0A4Y2RAX1_ARAVE|nr:Copia protein [Araneus ventricosus]